MDISTAISDYGFPIIAVLGLLWVVWFIWKFITNEIKVKLAETNTILIGLIDRIRVLDNGKTQANKEAEIRARKGKG